MSVVFLPLKCPLCDGKRLIYGCECTFCRGTGNRPTDAEIAARRKHPTDSSWADAIDGSSSNGSAKP